MMVAMETETSVLPVRDIVRGDLVVRRYRPDDAEALSAAIDASTEHLLPWMPWVPKEPAAVSERRDFIVACIRNWNDGLDMNLGMFLADEVAGGCGLHRRRGPRCLEIGYWVHAAHIGKGYATAAAGALTSAAFTLPEVEYVEIHHDAANRRSRRVPEKLGYELVAVEPDEKTAPAEVGMDCTWRVLRNAWHGPPAWSD
jgi:ribosomal-protein-serine acetyltransferase